MRRRLASFALAAAVAAGCGAEATAAAPLTPWQFFRELTRPPHLKKHRPWRPPVKTTKARSEVKREASIDPPEDTTVPIPRTRPLRPGDPAPAPEPVATASAEPHIIPLRPGGVASASGSPVPFPVPRPRPPDFDIEPLAMLPADPLPAIELVPAMPELTGCAASLAALGVEAQPLAPISEGACGIAAPTSVASLENGAVKLPIKARVNCQMAETAARWLHDDVQPAATTWLGYRVTGLRVAASYDCRTRDHVAGAQLSEHAFGNAIDFSAFQVNGRWIEVGGTHEPKEQAFLDTIRKKACGPFKTVLGPGSDSYHADHLHVDLAKRGKNKTALYCK